MAGCISGRSGSWTGSEMQAEFQAELLPDVSISAVCLPSKKKLTAQDGQEIAAYEADHVSINGRLNRGAAALADGLFKIRIARDARRFGIASWRVILALAAVTGAVGLALVLRPWDSVRVLAALLGVSLLAEGILNLWVALSTVKIVPNQRPDVVEGTYSEISDTKLYE